MVGALTRRSILRSLIAAPFIVKAASLMPVRSFFAAPSAWGDKLTYSAVGADGYLEDVIFDITPADFRIVGLSNAARVLHEWRTDALARARPRLN